MTIRYTCEKCGSVLKIKDDRAGKDGHCPKCKATFVVPAPEPEVVAAAAAPDTPAPAARLKQAAPAAAPAVEDADFDPVAFLMTGKEEAAKSAPAGKPAKAGGEAADMRGARGAGAAAYSASEEPDERVGGPRKSLSIDEDDEPPRPKGKSKRGAASSAAQTADEMLRVNASTNAKDLLTKTMEESRIRAAQMPEDRKRPGVDYKSAFKDLFFQYAPYTAGFVALLIGAYVLSNYMMSAGSNLPALGYVTGTVTKGGDPLIGAKVSFIPVDTKASEATGYSDQDGYFELKYVEGVPGAVLGKNRVEVQLIGPNGREVVPAKTPYGYGSNVIETVMEGSQTINITIP